MMSTLERALTIAVTAHAGQTDKAGEPYILHPIRVMLRMQTEDERIVAVLQDVVEDSAWTIEDLAAEGFSNAVVQAVDALTKRAGESRVAAAERAAQVELARVVKLADNAENMDLSRIPVPSEADRKRLHEYEQVRSILLQAGRAR
jgi:guanosine-3',5'-bis(diphosphate) 3'-pyrophosphohydrolase